MAYFLIAVATKRNLQLYTEWKMAGFTSSVNGYWAFVDIDRGEYVSFLHGARVYGLYKVTRKIALEKSIISPSGCSSSRSDVLRSP